jgi:hypothetical protein
MARRMGSQDVKSTRRQHFGAQSKEWRVEKELFLSLSLSVFFLFIYFVFLVTLGFELMQVLLPLEPSALSLSQFPKHEAICPLFYFQIYEERFCVKSAI